MHVEFSWYLHRLLEQVETSDGAKAPRLPEATDCPDYVPFFLSSPVTFERATKGQSIDGSPRRLAELVIQAAEQEREQRFTFSIGGQGHINANPTPRLIEQFLGSLLQHGAKSLLSETPLILGGEQAAGAVDSEFHSFSRKEMVRRAEKLAQQNLDIKELLSSGSARPAWDEMLMLLALMGDAELEVRPYLEGLSGRQNIPWYCARFRQDLSRCVYPDRPRWQDDTIAAVNLFSEATSPREVVIRSGLLQLLSFRKTYFIHGIRKRRPELSLYAVLRLIRTFYSFFNDPDARSVLVDRESTRLPGLRLIAFHLAALAAAGLGDLEQRFVLD